MPFIAMFAVANSALINMLMASRLHLRHGPPGRAARRCSAGCTTGRQTPWVAIIFTTAIAFGLIYFVSTSDSDVVPALGGTTALLLLGVFTIVNIVVLVLRRDDIGRAHFRTPTVHAGHRRARLLLLHAAGHRARPDPVHDRRLAARHRGRSCGRSPGRANRAFFGKKTYLRDPEDLRSDDAPRN